AHPPRTPPAPHAAPSPDPGTPQRPPSADQEPLRPPIESAVVPAAWLGHPRLMNDRTRVTGVVSAVTKACQERTGTRNQATRSNPMIRCTVGCAVPRPPPGSWAGVTRFGARPGDPPA